MERDFAMSSDQWARWFSERGSDDLDLLLFAIWDPIGVSDSAVFAGEYASYAPDVLRYVQADDAAGLTAYLRETAATTIGVSTPEPPEDAARRVINGAYASAYKWAGRPLPDGPPEE